METGFTPYPFHPRHYAGSVPTLVDGVDAERRAVAIVGGGPVGMTLALALARQGIRAVLIEADDSVCTGSRAICISRRSLEIFRRLGVADGFLTHGLPWTGGRSFYRDAEVFRFTMHHDDEQSLPPMINIAQYRIEQLLLDELERHADLVEIRWQTRVTACTQTADGATLTLRSDDAHYTMHADWVVACDGGRSTIREALGLRLAGTAYEGRYVIVDIALPSTRPTERLAYFDPPSNPGSTVLVHKQPDNVWRIDYQLRDDEDAEAAVQPANVLPRVQSVLDSMGETAAWQPIWISLYKANALTLERYRHGRAMFAGDAAHLVPIFGVRGANSGIDDADNLGWKLAAVVKGHADASLLDSYSDERVFAARENLGYGMKSTEFMAPPSFAFDLMRRAVLGLAERHPEVRSLINPRQTHAIAYRESPLNAGDGGDAAAFRSGPPPGTVLPECRLQYRRDGRIVDGHLTELIEPCFTVLRFESGDEAAHDAWQTMARTLPVTCRVVAIAAQDHASEAGAYDFSGRLYAAFDATPGTTYLIRPDGHVLARWRNAQPQQAADAIARCLSSRAQPEAV